MVYEQEPEQLIEAAEQCVTATVSGLADIVVAENGQLGFKTDRSYARQGLAHVWRILNFHGSPVRIELRFTGAYPLSWPPNPPAVTVDASPKPGRVAKHGTLVGIVKRAAELG